MHRRRRLLACRRRRRCHRALLIARVNPFAAGMQHSGGQPTSFAVAAALLEASPPSSQLNAVAVDAYARCSSRALILLLQTCSTAGGNQPLSLSLLLYSKHRRRRRSSTPSPSMPTRAAHRAR
jgi:hypothetical protein